MPTTQKEISEWFDEGVARGKRYMLVMCDTFDWTDCPVFFDDLTEARKRRDQPEPMEKYMESYDLSQPKDPQLKTHRAHCL